MLEKLKKIKKLKEELDKEKNLIDEEVRDVIEHYISLPEINNFSHMNISKWYVTDENVNVELYDNSHGQYYEEFIRIPLEFFDNFELAYEKLKLKVAEEKRIEEELKEKEKEIKRIQKEEKEKETLKKLYSKYGENVLKEK